MTVRSIQPTKRSSMRHFEELRAKVISDNVATIKECKEYILTTVAKRGIITFKKDLLIWQGEGVFDQQCFYAKSICTENHLNDEDGIYDEGIYLSGYDEYCQCESNREERNEDWSNYDDKETLLLIAEAIEAVEEECEPWGCPEAFVGVSDWADRYPKEFVENLKKYSEIYPNIISTKN